MQTDSNTKSKRQLLTIVGGITVVVAAAFFVAGCGGGDGGSNPPTNTPTPPPVVVADPNGENVRPDVRVYIESTQPESAKTRAALFQYAKAMEKAITDADNKELSIQHGQETMRASECLTYTLGDDVRAVDESYKIELELLPIILNTDERNLAYFTYNDQLGGEVFRGTPHAQIASACDINPADLPN